MKIKNILLIILCVFFINNAYSNYIKNDKIILRTGENITLKSKINTYCNVVKLFSSNTYSLNKKDLKNKIIKDLIIIDTYQDSIKKYNISINKESLETIYKDSAEIKNIPLTNFKKLIEKKYKIKDNFIKGFITNNLTLNKMQKLLISEDIIISDREIANFFNTSNYKKNSKNLYEIKLMEISFNRKKIKNSFIFFKNLINGLEPETELDKINSEITYKTIELTPNNKNYYFLKDYVDNVIAKNIIGPFFIGKYIYLYKILEKKNKTDDYRPYIKISYTTLQKKKLDENKNTKKFLQLETTLTKKQIDKAFNLSNKSYWAYKDTTDQLLYDKIRKLKINQISDIIETTTGWYIAKIIDKTFDQKSNIYNYIVDNIMMEKIKLLTLNFKDKITKNINVKYYR